LASGVPIGNIISNPDLKNVYEVPLVLERQNLTLKVLQTLRLKPKKASSRELKNWPKGGDG